MIDSIGPQKTGPIQKIKKSAKKAGDAKISQRDRNDTDEDSPEPTQREGRKGSRIDDSA
ncbi:MAG: hypothetical protein ACI9JM_001131 [Halioglobus sp.]|jgi:hypothetical protein